MEWRAKAEERLEWTVEQFAQRLITLAEAEEILWQLQEEGHYDLDFIQPLLVYLNQLQASHAAFAAGNSFFEQGDYLRALDEYAKVREDDLNYAAAQTRAAEALQAFRDMHLAEVDLAVENKDYATAVQILENALAQREDLVLREELSAVVEYWHQHDLEQLLEPMNGSIDARKPMKRHLSLFSTTSHRASWTPGCSMNSLSRSLFSELPSTPLT